jgi:uncharacterized membrane protein YbhN (UPF0104 family)
MKKLNIALLFLGLGFLAYLLWRVGPGDLVRQMSGLGWGVIPLILSEGVANLAHTLGWRRCIDKTHPSIPLMRLFPMAMAGFAINYLLPTASLGGEASKAALLASSRPAPEAVSSVVLDKLSTAMAHLLLALGGALFVLGYARLPAEIWVAMALATVLLAGGMGGFLLIQRHGKMGALLRWLTDRRVGGTLALRATRHISDVDDALKRFYRERPLDLALAVGWHLLGHSAAILQAWLFLWLLHQPAALSKVACAGFISLWFDLLTFAVPLNIGALEGSRIVALKAIGNDASLGMAFGVSVRIAQVFWACFGLISYGLLTVRKPGWSTSRGATLPTRTDPSAS